MSIKSELHEAILRKGGKIPTHGGIAAALDELNRLPSGGGVTSWNDLTDKPFGTEIGMVEVLGETMANGETLGQICSKPFGFVLGKTYLVNWSGTSYECVAKEVYMTDGEGDEAVEVHVGLGVETDVFVIADASPEIQELFGRPGFITIKAVVDDDFTVTLSIHTEGEIVKTIEPKYLPESLQFGAEEVYILPESELTFEMSEDLGMNIAFIEFAHDFVVGETYAVNFGGTVYNCTCVASEDGSLLLGNLAAFGLEDTGEPFVLGVISGMPMVIPLVEVQTAVVSVKGNKINTIDPKYAPSLLVIDLISLGCPAATLGQNMYYDWSGYSDFNAYRVLEKGSCIVRLKVSGNFGGNKYDEHEFRVFASAIGTPDLSGQTNYITHAIFCEGYFLRIDWGKSDCSISFYTLA